VPEVGEHSRELAAEFCTADELEALIDGGVIIQHQALVAAK